MKIIDLVVKIQSNYIMSEHLHADELIGYMDDIIDVINDDLQAKYPLFSEFGDWATAYNDAHAGEEGFDYLRGDGNSDISGDLQRKWFRNLWESINGAGSWAANPWVWVVEFKRVQP